MDTGFQQDLGTLQLRCSTVLPMPHISAEIWVQQNPPLTLRFLPQPIACDICRQIQNQLPARPGDGRRAALRVKGDGEVKQA